MDSRELVNRVRHKNSTSATPVQEAFVNQAIVEAIVSGECMNQGLVQVCLAEARKLESESSVGSEDTSTESDELNMSATLLAKSIFRMLDDEVRSIRRELFDDDPEAPFPEWSDAIAWLRCKKAEVEPRKIDLPKVRRLLKRQEEICREVEEETGEQISTMRRIPQLDLYQEPEGTKGWDPRISVRIWDLKLRRLLSFVEKAELETGLPGHLALLYLLTGKRRLPGISVQVEGTGALVPMTTVKISRLTPSWKDMRKAYRLIRDLRGNRKAPDFISQEIARSIDYLGGVPEKGRMKFWKVVAADVNEKQIFGLENEISEKAVRMRFERLPEDWQSYLYRT